MSVWILDRVAKNHELCANWTSRRLMITMNWNFLEKMGFGFRWKWIKHCIHHSQIFSVLINRAPNGFFPSQRGLRQGDPLSSLLFILAIEGMSNLVNKARGKGWIIGFQVGEANILEVTRLLYAKDSFVICEVVEEQVLILRVIFIIFEATSGLHINRRKSIIYLIITGS